MRMLLIPAVAALGMLAAPVASANEALAKKHNCLACHQVDRKLVGPSYKEIAKRYKGQPDAAQKLFDSVRKGSQGKWGPTPMPDGINAKVPDGDVKALVGWILSL